ncbi:MAG: MarR family winged helix-turn-helix transcriptional regulator [Thermonemataceae bacterium]
MKDVISLLEYYEEFKKAHPDQGLEVFGEWLRQRFIAEEDFLTREQDVNEAGLEVMLSYLLGGIIGYYENWVKLAYEDLPLRSMGDFGILMAVESMGNPSKKQVVLANTQEPSTCIEAIKRLVRAGILEETIDQQDRRIKRVSISKEGQAMMKTLEVKMQNLSYLLVGNLSPLEIRSLIPAFKKLFAFHERIYKNGHLDEIKELYKL